MAEGNKKFAFDEKRTNRLLVVSELDADFLGGDVFLLNVKVSPIGFIKLFFTCYSQATNRIRSSCYNYTQVLVYIGDVNDNAPSFYGRMASIQISEAFPIHQTFFIAKITDPDRNEV